MILDAGIATEENLQRLGEKRFHYICVSRTLAEGVPEDTDDLEIIRENTEKAVKVEVKRFKSLFIIFSTKQSKKCEHYHGMAGG